MLKTKVIEKIRPSKKIQELFNSNQLNTTSINIKKHKINNIKIFHLI